MWRRIGRIPPLPATKSCTHHQATQGDTQELARTRLRRTTGATEPSNSSHANTARFAAGSRPPSWLARRFLPMIEAAESLPSAGTRNECVGVVWLALSRRAVRGGETADRSSKSATPRASGDRGGTSAASVAIKAGEGTVASGERAIEVRTVQGTAGTTGYFLARVLARKIFRQSWEFPGIF